MFIPQLIYLSFPHPILHPDSNLSLPRISQFFLFSPPSNFLHCYFSLPSFSFVLFTFSRYPPQFNPHSTLNLQHSSFSCSFNPIPAPPHTSFLFPPTFFFPLSPYSFPLSTSTQTSLPLNLQRSWFFVHPTPFILIHHFHAHLSHAMFNPPFFSGSHTRPPSFLPALTPTFPSPHTPLRAVPHDLGGAGRGWGRE